MVPARTTHMTSATYELTRATRPRAADNAAERIADQHSLRRGSLIFQDVTDVGGSPDSEGEEGGEEADSSDEAAGTGVAEITWDDGRCRRASPLPTSPS